MIALAKMVVLAEREGPTEMVVPAEMEVLAELLLQEQMMV
jgi:hypothetical protein